MQVQHVRLGRTSQQRMREWLTQRLPSHFLVQVHGRVMIGEYVQDGLRIAAESKLDRYSSEKMAAEPAPLSAGSDSQ